MFPRAKKPTALDYAIARAMDQLAVHEVTSEEYAEILNNVVILHKMQVEEKPDQLSMDTAAIIAANLIGILLIIRHENVNVIASRAMGLVIKPK